MVMGREHRHVVVRWGCESQFRWEYRRNQLGDAAVDGQILWEVHDALECFLDWYCSLLNDALGGIFGTLQGVIDAINAVLPG
jgi:hypothetical protein